MRISPYFYLKGFYGSFSQYESDITDINHFQTKESKKQNKTGQCSTHRSKILIPDPGPQDPEPIRTWAHTVHSWIQSPGFPRIHTTRHFIIMTSCIVDILDYLCFHHKLNQYPFNTRPFRPSVRHVLSTAIVLVCTEALRMRCRNGKCARYLDKSTE